MCAVALAVAVAVAVAVASKENSELSVARFVACFVAGPDEARRPQFKNTRDTLKTKGVEEERCASQGKMNRQQLPVETTSCRCRR